MTKSVSPCQQLPTAYDAIQNQLLQNVNASILGQNQPLKGDCSGLYAGVRSCGCYRPAQNISGQVKHLASIPVSERGFPSRKISFSGRL